MNTGAFSTIYKIPPKTPRTVREKGIYPEKSEHLVTLVYVAYTEKESQMKVDLVAEISDSGESCFILGENLIKADKDWRLLEVLLQ